MSTKIYGGMKFVSDSPVSAQHGELWEHMNKIRPKLKEMALHHYLESNALELVHQLDARTIDESADTSESIMNKMMDHETVIYREIKTKNIKSAGDNEISLCVLPTDTCLLLYPILGNSSMMQYLYSDKIIEYGYWNNTDQPDILTDEEWEQREADWDKIDRFNQGYSYHICEVNEFHLYLEVDEVIEKANKIPIIQRATHTAVNYLINERTRSSDKENKPTFPHIMKASNKITKELKKGEHEGLIDEIADKLISPIKKDCLFLAESPLD